uniref:Uncharacterized protein n=1 Tax=Oryza sativa subsp. japonica TaxID=39947 RepID=Q6EUG1_ORYSJ|nr:hypothetical protein [Oryza sativa Japonica Group]
MASWAAKSRVRATAGWLLSNGGDAGRCSPFDCSSSIPLPWSRGRDNGAPSKINDLVFADRGTLGDIVVDLLLTIARGERRIPVVLEKGGTVACRKARQEDGGSLVWRCQVNGLLLDPPMDLAMPCAATTRG